MAEPVGTWWRAEEYEIVHGVIRPTPGATIMEYDPWAGRESDQPYRSLLELLDTPGLFPSTPEGDARLLAWVKAHGLLGLLSHYSLSATLAPRWGPEYPVRIGSTPPRVVPTVKTYMRTGRGWQTMEREIGRPESRGEPQPERGTLVGPAVRTELEKEGPIIPRAEVVWARDHDEDLGPRPLGLAWGPFFPTVRMEGRETHPYPEPLTEAFWRDYGEPVVTFLNAANLLRSALRGVAAHPDEAVNLGLQQLRELAEPMHLGLELEPAGPTASRAGLQWGATSLLAAYAMMALLDLSDTRPHVCERCGKLFLSSAYQARYCSDPCRHTAQKRAWRSRKR